MKGDTSHQLKSVPVVAIRGSVLFPNTDVPLAFGRPKSVTAINESFQKDKLIVVVTQRDPRVSNPKEEDLYNIGTIATITQMMSTDGEIHALIRGRARVRIKKIISETPYLTAFIEELPDKDVSSPTAKSLAKQLLELFKRSINLGKQVEIMTVMKLVSGTLKPVELVDQVASFLEIKTSERQKILEETSVIARLKKVLDYLGREVSVMDLDRTIDSKTQARFQEQMRRTMLREKKRTIEEELNEGSEDDMGGTQELKEYKKKIKLANMPKEVHEKADKELKRLALLSPHNPEGAYIRNYLDWLVEMPWDKTSPNSGSLKKAVKILETRHYGMKKAKDRIIEYLAVMKIKKANKESENQPTILCFIGPPGVGKTSIGKSIAEALGRKICESFTGGHS